ncbi:hypothetical protein ACD631_16255 [Alteromonas macleodii]|uniref:hypothetical protein n=1 Tax=Alteromonas macleodii TaxID=28108 RepID=UPI0036F462D5
MEFLFFIGFVYFLFIVFKSINGDSQSNSSDNSSPESSNDSTQARQTSYRTEPKPNSQTFRPSSPKSASPKINFGASPTVLHKAHSLSVSDLKGLHDAFTGAPLSKSLGLHQCQSCKVYYHSESLRVLREANGSKCVSCQSTKITPINTEQRTERGRDHTPNVVTLNNYKDFVGKVVTFEGVVRRVNESRRGNDFAVMFENESWVQGFKLVFFSGAVTKVGGATYIKGLTRRKMKVRGLIVNHPKFGYQIIVSEKSMILSVH